MAERLLKKGDGAARTAKVAAKEKVAAKTENVAAKGDDAARQIVLVATYKERQLAWIKKNGVYNYPVKDGDEFDADAFARIKELWLYADVKGRRHCFVAEFAGKMTRDEFIAAYPSYAKLGKSKQKTYYVFKTSYLDYGPKLKAPDVLVRVIDFATGYAKKVKKAVAAYHADGDFGSLANYLPSELSQVPRERLRVCEALVQLDLCFPFDIPKALAADRVSQTKAMQILSLSRHSYSKLISKGVVVGHQDGDETYFLMSDLEKAKSSAEYIGIKNGIVDSRNTLNDLTGKDWIPETKSYLYQKGLGVDSADAEIERMHPAPYSFQDIGHLIRFFTKRGMRVLDPFGGVGSTAKACEIDGRLCTSIELSPKWHELSIRRLEVEVGEGASRKHKCVFH